MNKINQILDNSIYQSPDGSVNVTVSKVSLLVIGAVALYFSIPERKRKNLLK